MTCPAAGKSSVIEVEPLLAWLAIYRANRGCFRCCWCFGSTIEACSTLLPQPAGAAGPDRPILAPARCWLVVGDNARVPFRPLATYNPATSAPVLVRSLRWIGVPVCSPALGDAGSRAYLLRCLITSLSAGRSTSRMVSSLLLDRLTLSDTAPAYPEHGRNLALLLAMRAFP